mmetsp:Transcript_19563/g.24184  ORF Transcript_19563/g.24184 Transcript_19563/m.24184 type:complete len:131 (+) Transcript_19563:147-539(+)
MMSTKMIAILASLVIVEGRMFVPDVQHESKRGRGCATIIEYHAGSGCTGRIISEESRTVGLTFENGCYEYAGVSGSEYCDDEGYHWIGPFKNTECKGSTKSGGVPQLTYELGCNSGYIDYSVVCSRGACA